MPKRRDATVPPAPLPPESGSGAAARPRPWLLGLAVLVLVSLAYLPALSGGFVWDDRDLIENDPTVRQLQPLHVYFQRPFFADDVQPDHDRGFYRPLVTLTLALDHAVGGGGPFQFHLTNLLLHLACCALLFALARRAGAPVLAATLGTAAFGLLPRLSESVAWISGRTDLLAALGVLLALRLHSTDERRRTRRLAAAASLFFGLLGKEVAAAGFVAIAVLEWRAASGAPGRLRRVAAHLTPSLAAFAAYGGLRLLVRTEAIPQLALPWNRRPLLALEALGSYAWMLVDPLRPRAPIGTLAEAEPLLVVLGLVSLLALAAAARLAWRRPPAPELAAWLALALAAILPVLHLLPVAVNVVAADRFLYLPAAGLTLAAATSGGRIGSLRVKRALAALALAALPAFAWATQARAREWGHELLFWTKARQTAPALSRVPAAALADLLFDHHREEEALALYREALATEQRYMERIGLRGQAHGARLRNSVAVTLSRLGRYSEAAELLERLVDEVPAYRRGHLNLALVQARALRFDEAEATLRRAVERFPGFELPRRVLDDIQANRAERNALPAPSANEELALVARRAELDEALGRSAEARAGWSRVLDAPGAPPELLRRATGFFVASGALGAAERAASRLASAAPDDPWLPALRLALAERRREETLPE